MKQEKKHNLPVRMEKELAREFKAACAMDGLPMNTKVINMIIDYLNNRNE